MRYLFFVLILFFIGCSKENDSPYSDVYDDIKGTWKQDYTYQGANYTDVYVFSEPKDSLLTVTVRGSVYQQRYWINKTDNRLVRGELNDRSKYIILDAPTFKDDKMYLSGKTYYR